MRSSLRIALISNNHALIDHLKIRLESKDFHVVTFPMLSTVLGSIYSDPPDIILIDIVPMENEQLKIIEELKNDSYFSIIPIIGLTRELMDERLDWKMYPLDDFISHPVKFQELISRISLSISRIQRVFDNNPLTRLPGNTSIQMAIEKNLGKPMAVCHIDVNNFKPYNDTYGFSAGDEVIRMVGRIMSHAVRIAGNGFAGHIGGDDFVFIVPFEMAENTCKDIINNFNSIIPEMFNPDDKEKGYYIAKDRKGETQKIPLLGISIAIVPTNSPEITHAGKVSELAAELKKIAKKSNHSGYAMDRRR